MDIIKYGSITIKTNHVNFKEAHTTTTYTERRPVETSKDILTEFLKHLDRHKTGEVHNIGLQVIEKDNKPQFVDLTWSVRTIAK
jgi:DNA-binding protein Fis